MDDTKTRIESLEVTVAYQAEILEDLNQTITAQWKLIEQLKRSLDQISDRLQEAESRAGLASPEKPPPHY